MILGIGIDIVDISRIETALEREHFLRRIFSPYEQEYIAKHGAASAAGFFAAKEAAAKAIGTGFDGFAPWEICVSHDALGKPGIVFEGKAREKVDHLKASRVHLSISHEKDYALAQVILEGEAP